MVITVITPAIQAGKEENQQFSLFALHKLAAVFIHFGGEAKSKEMEAALTAKLYLRLAKQLSDQKSVLRQQEIRNQGFCPVREAKVSSGSLTHAGFLT